MSSTPTLRSATRQIPPRSVDLLRWISIAGVVAIAVVIAATTSSAPTRPGGEASISIGKKHRTLLLPAANLPAADRPLFNAGKALAQQPWIKAPSSTDARDGLGPLYNARSCVICHLEGGRGEVAEAGAPLIATIVRVRGADPIYGTQLQTASIDVHAEMNAGVPEIAAEAAPIARYETSTFRYPDGQTVELRAPKIELTKLGYGPLAEGTKLSLRHTPSLSGVGLIELIPDAELARLEDPDDKNGDGISGRSNFVGDPSGKKSLQRGRFGHKASQPNLRAQVASALANDMGLSNPVFPDQPCTEGQAACRRAPNGNNAEGFEVPEALLKLLVDFTMSIGVPERRKPDHPKVVAGREHFFAAGCDGCHHPSYRTASSTAYPHLSEQTIWPYSDLLLHDLGDGLADESSDGAATGREWRTAPLWGVGLAKAVNHRTGFLHDGRARTIDEAILWHGGEAAASRERFAHLTAEERSELIAFVKSL